MVRLITPFRDKTPIIHPDSWVDPSARIIGEVTIERGVSVWPLAVLRADSSPILVGRGAAILDLCLVEAPTDHPVTIGEEALISHRAVIHGAEVQARALVGIGAIILDGAVISSGSLVGAGCLIPQGTRIPANSLVMGVPGKVVRQTTEEERALILEQINELYAKSRYYKPGEGQ